MKVPRACLATTACLALVAGTSARADEWASFQDNCGDLQFPELIAFTKLARSWEVKEVASPGSLKVLATKTCPAYLQNANAALSVDSVAAPGTVTLQQYVAAQTKTFGDALSSEAEGKARSAYLKTHYDRLLQTLKRYGLDFNRTYCGKLLLERYNHVQSELAKVEAATKNVQTTCPAQARAITDAASPKLPHWRSSAAGGEPSAPAVPNRESKVTGTTPPGPAP